MDNKILAKEASNAMSDLHVFGAIKAILESSSIRGQNNGDIEEKILILCHEAMSREQRHMRNLRTLLAVPIERILSRGVHRADKNNLCRRRALDLST